MTSEQQRPIDVVVLAAGRGSRLRSLGEDRPKWLLDVGGRTIASRQLEAVSLLRDRRPGRLRSVTVVTGHAATALREAPPVGADLLHNPEYLERNNWYSLLLALRALPDDSGRVVVMNGDLFASPPWMLEFLLASADTHEQGALAIDFDRALTDESMKVSSRGDGAGDLELEAIGKDDRLRPVGEYVGMLQAAGDVLQALRSELESFTEDPAADDEWYEGAVGRSAARGARWHLWPTASSDWVEIDDAADLEQAERLARA